MDVTLKLATSLDGRIATASGESRWITGVQAREQGHRLRALHAMIAVGVETAIADDPELTVRLPDFVGDQPVRVVFDSRQRLPLDSRLVLTARAHRTVVVTSTSPRPDLVSAGVQVLDVPGEDGRPAMGPALEALGMVQAEGYRRRLQDEAVPQGLIRPDQMEDALDAFDPGDLLIEGGGRLAASFLKADAVDRIEWFRAPLILGEEGRAAIGPLHLKLLAGAPRFRRIHVQALGDDLWERYERA